MLKLILFLNDGDRPRRLMGGTVVFALVAMTALAVLAFLPVKALPAACWAAFAVCLLLAALAAPAWHPHWGRPADFLLVPGVITLFVSLCYLMF